MAKLADAADLKSADPKGLWGFKSPSRHQVSFGSESRRIVPAGLPYLPLPYFAVGHVQFLISGLSIPSE